MANFTDDANWSDIGSSNDAAYDPEVPALIPTLEEELTDVVLEVFNIQRLYLLI